jgi:hypothetical protein
MGQTIAADYAESIKDEVLTLERAFGGDADALAEFGGEGSFGIYEYLNECAVDVSTAFYDSGRTRVVVLRTTGGPGCEIVRESMDGGTVTVFAYSNGEPTAIREVYAPMVSAALDDLAGAIECPRHEGAFDCTPFCTVCEGNQEYSPG